VYLEAPIGTRVADLPVRPESDADVPLSVKDVASLKLTVLADPDDHPADTETIDLNHASPYPVYITSFAARSAIGRIEGELSLQTPRLGDLIRVETIQSGRG
jgi:hypothetical protein